MEYRVEEIARAAGISVDTVRFYQTRGLLPPPERRGRSAIYSDHHLERLKRVRQLNRQGLTLKAVRQTLEDPGSDGSVKESLLRTLDETEEGRTLSRRELARRAGLPEFLIELGEQTGWLRPIEADGEPRYTESDLRSVEGATLLLRSGFPMQELLALARDHSAHTQEIADRAIDLFDRHVRGARQGQSPPSRDAIAQTLRELLPAVVTMVAHHFQRTLTLRARARLVEASDDDTLEAVLAAAQGSELRVSWR